MEPPHFFLRGEIDVASADGLLTTLRSVAGRTAGDLMIDCMDLEFIGAAGISAVIVAHGELLAQGRCLCLVHPSPFFKRVLAVLDLSHLIAVDPVAANST